MLGNLRETGIIFRRHELDHQRKQEVVPEVVGKPMKEIDGGIYCSRKDQMPHQRPLEAVLQISNRMSALEEFHDRHDGLRVGRKTAEPRGDIAAERLDVYQIEVDVRIDQLQSLNALVAGGVPDYGKGQPLCLRSLYGFDYGRNEMRSGNQVYGCRTEGLKLQHKRRQLLHGEFHPVPALLADLVVLAVLAVKRTAAEEYHPGSLFS